MISSLLLILFMAEWIGIQTVIGDRSVGSATQGHQRRGEEGAGGAAGLGIVE